MPEKRLTQVVHEALAAVVQPGETCIDATAGNGRDTVVLAQLVGALGRVHAFDVLAEAIERTRQALAASGCARQTTLWQRGHETLQATLPTVAQASVAAITFNLGFLPGGDKIRCTRAPETLAAIAQAWTLLRPAGLLSLLCYTGHPGGRDETDAVLDWAHSLPPTDAHLRFQKPEGPVVHPPELLLVTRLT
ncbi:MAG: class I SAM-dependent methyltransferase [Opitutales bacterium]